MADKEAPTVKKAPATKKSAAPRKKATVQKNVASKKVQEHVSVEDMHKLLGILQDGLASRDKSVDYLQQQIALNQEQIEQNKKFSLNAVWFIDLLLHFWLSAYWQ